VDHPLAAQVDQSQTGGNTPPPATCVYKLNLSA